MDAGSLKCPGCGAVISGDCAQCQYCHALLETVACPKCLGMMFAGTKFCPHCGAAAQQIAPGTATKLPCPRCQTPMQEVQVGGNPLDECLHCGGLWIDVGRFDAICSSAEARTAATGLELPPPVPIDPHVRYLPCPQCRKLMSRTNYAGRSGIVIGVCRQHGIWLERDEIRQIVQFITSGGLDRARQIETSKLEQERAALESARTLSDLTNPGGSRSFINTSNESGGVDLLNGLAWLIKISK